MSRILIMNILNKSSCMLGSKARPVNRANAVGSNFNILNGGTGFLTNSLNISALTCVVHSRCLSLHVNRKANQNTCTFLERKSGNVPIMQTLGRKSYIKYGPVLLWDQIMQTLGRKSYIKSGPVLLWDQIKVCYSVMSSTATNQDVAKKVPTKPLMKIKTKKKIRLVEDALQYNRVATYPVGQELNLESLAKEIVSQDTYKIVDMPTDLQGNLQDVIMTTAKYKFEGQIRDAFFFRDGTVSLWTMSESEKDDVLQLVRRHCIHPYNPVLTEQESEIIPVQNDMASKLVRGKIHIRSLPGDEKYEEITMMEKFAFSNAMAQSVTLAINENKLEKFIDQLESETQLLRDGQPSQLKRRDINMKLGEVFLHRHEINLESGFLDVPDVYWERDDLEQLYRSTFSDLNVSKRIQVYNARLNYCSEILQLLSNQLNDKHHVRLEWIIIILILIEVLFECLHYAERFGWIPVPSQVSDPRPLVLSSNRLVPAESSSDSLVPSVKSD
ncbi:required for meiotic nuclear division protein 1 homolog isoform X6 [Dreissena polymorpha]|uniref:required for meiotic nuclear division protein 1 homolog isoform X6 n=1 Tax=Dreissena polymorpha TaxID=45954 RepID=UPI00226509E9|nr:required for meiotic nuclear division protein 1 homolog isoform X6 [Dreissena polymorpha]